MVRVNALTCSDGIRRVNIRGVRFPQNKETQTSSPVFVDAATQTSICMSKEKEE